MTMKYIKLFENYIGKIYKNVNDVIESEKIDIYQIPFALGDGDGTCIYNAETDWKCCIGNYHVYDYITDSDISNALQKDLSNINITKGWEYQDKEKFEYETAYTNKEKHILRVAKLVQEMKKGVKINPILMCFDSMSYNYDMVNHIQDGNHRIRALQYLKYDYYPANVYGSHAKDLIQYIEDNYNI